MTNIFLYGHWLQLSLPTRQKIAGQFGIIKRGSTEVFNNTIKSDGYLIQEIESALNIDAIQTYLGSNETDMTKLWTMMIDKIEGREVIAPTIINEIVIIEPIIKRRGRPAKSK